jgi:hypothetical protein
MDKKRRRTRPECNSGIRRLSNTPGYGMRGWMRELDRRLKEMTHGEVIRKSLCMEITNLIFESPIGLREPRDGLRRRPLFGERVAGERLRKEEMIDNWCRLLGTSSLKEGAI